MQIIITIPDDQVPGRCITATNGSNCPFGRRGCWVRDPKNCPLQTANEVEPLEMGVDGSLCGFKFPLPKWLIDSTNKIFYVIKPKP